MISSDMTHNEIIAAKKDVQDFIHLVKNVALSQKSELEQVDIDFFSFLSKQIIFLKNLYFGAGKPYIIAVLISDYYNYILAIIKNEHRYIYLNERSMLENYVRLILYKMVEDDFHVGKMLQTLKTNFPDILKSDDFSLLKSEYRKASSYIHGGEELSKSLATCFDDCLNRKIQFENKNSYYKNVKKLLKLNVKLLIRKYLELVNGVFHRRKSLLGYLLGNSMVNFLFFEKEKKQH